jgi:hypothetical protein
MPMLLFRANCEKGTLEGSGGHQYTFHFENAPNSFAKRGCSCRAILDSDSFAVSSKNMAIAASLRNRK